MARPRYVLVRLHPAELVQYDHTPHLHLTPAAALELIHAIERQLAQVAIADRHVGLVVVKGPPAPPDL